MPPQQQTSQKLFIDLSGRGGLAPRWFGDEGDTTAQYPQYRYIGTQDQTTPLEGESTAYDLAAGIWNPSRRYGFMAPANNSFSSITNNSGVAFANEIRATCYDPLTGHAFYADNGSATRTGGATIFQNITITANTWTAATGGGTFSYPLANLADYFTDIKMYQIDGAPFVFAAYANSTSSLSDIVVFQPGGASTGASDTWLSSVASGSFDTGPADYFFVPSTYYMYMVGANLVHRIDGTAATGGANGTALSNVLIAASNITFTHGVSWNGNIWLAGSEVVTAYTGPAAPSSIFPGKDDAFSSNQARVYVWDESVTSIENVQYITITGVKVIQKMYVTRSGKLRMLCISSKRTVQIREYNGITFDVIEEAGINSYLRYRDCFQVAGDCVAWTGNDGNFYQHGPVVPGEIDQLTINGNATGIFTSPSTTRMGATLYLDNNNSNTTARTAFFVSGLDTVVGTAVNKMWYPNTVGNTPNVGNVFSLVKFFPSVSKVNYVRVYHNAGSATGTTVQGTLSVYLNQATTPQRTFSITTSDVNKGWKFCPVNQGAKNAVFAIQVEIQWNVATTTADSSDWLPRTLEVDFISLDKLQ